MAAVREHGAVLEQRQGFARDRVDRARRRDEHVRVGQRVLETGDPVAVHVRLERRDGVDFDDRDAAALALRVPRQALADPAVPDDAELASGERQVRQPVDRRERRLPRPVAVVEQVLAAGVVGRDRREREPAGGLHRPQARDAGCRLLGDAVQLRRDLRPMLDDP